MLPWLSWVICGVHLVFAAFSVGSSKLSEQFGPIQTIQFYGNTDDLFGLTCQVLILHEMRTVTQRLFERRSCRLNRQNFIAFRKLSGESWEFPRRTDQIQRSKRLKHPLRTGQVPGTSRPMPRTWQMGARLSSAAGSLGCRGTVCPVPGAHKKVGPHLPRSELLPGCHWHLQTQAIQHNQE